MPDMSARKKGDASRYDPGRNGIADERKHMFYRPHLMLQHEAADPAEKRAVLQRYGYHDLAARICDATIMNALRWGDVNERYCCDTGKPLGVPDYGMSACVFAMMTDGAALDGTRFRWCDGRNAPVAVAE